MKASFPLLLSILQSPFGFHPNEIKNRLRQENLKNIAIHTIMDKIMFTSLGRDSKEQQIFSRIFGGTIFDLQ